ncbi:MAG: hypothetical protein ABIK07_06450 [Planctomycetota bacterium]
MIIQPDFIEHWRTRMLVDLLGGDEMAPMYVIRILSHCNNRKKTQIEPMQNPGLKALCRYNGDAELLESSLLESEWIEKTETGYDVPKFAEHNAQLVNSWENGKKGGRPKKNPIETQSKPSNNPTETHGNQRREEKRREEVKEKEKKETQSGDCSPSLPNEDQLNFLLDSWNELPKSIAPQVSNHRSDSIITGWKKVQRTPELKAAFADIPHLMAKIRDGTFLHGNGWFKFSWLFGKKNSEWNVLKILDGNYERNENGGRRHDPARVESQSTGHSLFD